MIENLLVLIKTKTTITFDDTVGAIALPTGGQLKIWKDPFALPNNSQVTIAKWCRKDSVRFKLKYEIFFLRKLINKFYNLKIWPLKFCDLLSKASQEFR